MKRVKYNITRYTKKGSYKFYGYGEIDEENLYTTYTDKYGNTIERTYEDCLKYLHPVMNKANQFKGLYLEYEDITFENDKGQLIELEKELIKRLKEKNKY